MPKSPLTVDTTFVKAFLRTGCCYYVALSPHKLLDQILQAVYVVLAPMREKLIWQGGGAPNKHLAQKVLPIGKRWHIPHVIFGQTFFLKTNILKGRQGKRQKEKFFPCVCVCVWGGVGVKQFTET